MDEIPDPFELYVRSVETQWSTVETATLIAPLGLALPAAAARQVGVDDVQRENVAIAGRSIRAAAWFRSLADAERAMRAYARLAVEGEWYPPLVAWRRRGHQLAQAVQHSLAERLDDAAANIAMLDAHTAEHGALVKQRGDHAKTADALAAQLGALEPRVDAPETWPPLLVWQADAKLACARAFKSLSEHSSSVVGELQALQALHTRHLELINDYSATSRRLEAEFVQRKGTEVALGAALHEADRQYGLAQWAAAMSGLRGLFLGFLAGGFAGCFYGCTNADISADAGLIRGGVLVAVIGVVIGVFAEYSTLSNRSADIAKARQRWQDATVAVAEAHANLERHRALMPSRLARP